MRADIIKRRGYPAYIAGDELALEMSSYPQTAQYLAERLAEHGDVVCELCCGIGVSLIELAKVFKHAVGVDSNGAILADCRHNLVRAGIRNYTLLESDVRSTDDILESVQADVFIYDIPYWGMHDMTKAKRNPNLQHVIHTIRQRITNSIVIYTPPNMTYTEVFGVLGTCEYNEVYIGERHDRNFVFLGSLIRQNGRTKTFLPAS